MSSVERRRTRSGWIWLHSLLTSRSASSGEYNRSTNCIHLKSGAGRDSITGTIVGDDDWWEDRIAEHKEAEHLRNRPLANLNELAILFDTMDTEEGDMVRAGGIGDRTPLMMILAQSVIGLQLIVWFGLIIAAT
ncbi:hypothetical protein ACP70R_020085 [Stipagrostis hirtigluma subsp. patula]